MAQKAAAEPKPAVEAQVLPEATEAWDAAQAREARQLLYDAQLLTDELARRQREEKLRLYRPHPKQRLFHQCDKHNRWALGGNRTGKTEVGAAELVWFARGTHPFKRITRPMDLWAVSLTNEVQRDVAQKKVLSYLDPKWIKGVKMREGRADDPDHGVIKWHIPST